jgi:hypothetical protein
MKNFINLKLLALQALFSASILAGTEALAQTPITQTIRGTVIDHTSRYPLVGAAVLLVGSDPINGTSTNANGEFVLQNVPLGRQTLEFTFLGYQKRVLNNVLVIGGKELQLEVAMVEDITQMQEVVVSGQKAKSQAQNQMAQVSARTFSVEETERFAGSLGDPARMVANYAGVTMQNDSRNDIIIRGNSPTGVLWRMEGVEIANPNHFSANGTTGGPVSMVNNNLLANSDFLTGAFPAEYGNALAGAFDLKMRSGNHYNTEFTGQIGFNGFELGAEGPLAKAKSGTNPSYLVNYRYSTLDLFSKMGFNMGTGAAIPEYQDLTFMVDIPGTKRGRFKIFGLMGTSYIELGRNYADTLGNSYSSRGQAIDYGSTLGLVAATHTYFFNENSKLQSSLSYQDAINKAVVDSLRNKNTLVLPYYRGTQNESKLTATLKYSQKLDARQNISIGVLADRFGVDFVDSVYQYEHQRFITNSNVQGNLYLVRGFGEYQRKVSANQTLYAGLHLQYVASNPELAAEPRLSYKWQASAKHAFYGGWGLHSQLQPKTVYFLETYNESLNTYRKTNNKLDMTRSQHFVAGYDWLPLADFRVKIETYYQNLWNAPVKASFPEFSMLNSGDNFGVANEDSLINKGKGENIGVEFTVEKFLSHGYYFLATASLFDSKYTGADGRWRNTAFNGSYVLNLLGGYELKVGASKWLTFDTKVVWAGGHRYVPIDTEASAASGSTEYDWSHAYQDKYNDYFRFDLRIGYKMNRAKWSQEWALDLQNLTGYQSIYAESYDVEKQQVYQTYQQGFYPMLLYRIHF